MKTKALCHVSFVLALMPLSGCGSGKVLRQADDSGAFSSPCAVALAPHTGSGRIDSEIRRLQKKVQDTARSVSTLERLGWLFVSKARLTFDAGYYTLAEQTAECLQSKYPNSPAALLLRGHVMQNLHRFQEAEAIARQLVASRESPFDYGLLGDALMEQGQLSEASDAYQRMVDLKPGLHSYSRAAHMLWLKGDLEGATQLMQMAVGASSRRDPQSTAWAHTRLAMYELQAGNTARASMACEAALNVQKDYAPALLVRGRILFAEGRLIEAIETLSRAAMLNPLPEYQWSVADTLRAAGRIDEARQAETRLSGRAKLDDPRTLSLYLATRSKDVHTALQLAEEELEVRKDVFTFDAVAWALRAVGRPGEALSVMKEALAHGTRDARLFLHAGVIAVEARQPREALAQLKKARSIQQMLLPSEQTLLENAFARVAPLSTGASSDTPKEIRNSKLRGNATKCRTAGNNLRRLSPIAPGTSSL